jgi:hypothetical protein
VLPQILIRNFLAYKNNRCVLTIKKDNNNSEILPLNDYVQIYEPALSHNDIMAIAEEFVRTHPKEIIIFASTRKATKEIAKKARNHICQNAISLDSKPFFSTRR